MKKVSALIFSALIALSASAVPAKRGLRPVRQADGTTVMVERVGDENRHFTLNQDGALLRKVNGIYRLADISDNGTLIDAAAPVYFSSEDVQRRIAATNVAATATEQSGPKIHRVAQIGKFPDSDFPGQGSPKALVILVEYSDVKFTLDDPHTYFSEMLSKEGFSSYGATGSCLEYFIESSMGNFAPEFDLYGPVTLSRTRSYYGGNDAYDQDSNPEQMVIEACRQLDATVDFTKYDCNGDGYIDNVFVFYAGQGEASYGDEDTVWPHSANISEWGYNIKLDGVRLGRYACTNEWEQNRPDGIGTFVHEFSHVLGLPDLYHTAAMANFTPGTWSVMDYGPYNNNGMTPPAYSSFERNAMGWITPEELVLEDGQVTLPDLRTSNKAYCLTNPSNPREFYLFENRQQQGCDKYLPGHGMLIWHVDYNATTWTQNTVNNDKSHQGVDLCEADGRDSKNQRTQGDAFPGSANVTRYQPRWWTGGTASIKLSGITETEGRISFAMEEAETPGDYLSVYDVVNGTSNTTTNVKVRGYIVGYAKSTFTEKSVEFSAPATVESNIVLADSETETYYANCIPVQLMAASDARNALNLKTNPGMLGAYVELYGDLERYMLVNGLKSVREYTILSNGNVSIDEIETSADNNDNDNAEWFNLQGMRVSPESMSDGIYIRRTAKSAEKVTIKR